MTTEEKLVLKIETLGVIEVYFILFFGLYTLAGEGDMATGRGRWGGSNWRGRWDGRQRGGGGEKK